MHWAIQYFGLPWGKGAQGPDAWCCWGIFRHCQKKHYDVLVPQVGEADGSNLMATIRAFRGHSERANWVEVSAPQDGDGVLMSTSQHPVHVGIWLDVDGGLVFHCDEINGVAAQAPDHLRLFGWRIIGYYRHRSRC
jgi:hypothetical protein